MSKVQTIHLQNFKNISDLEIDFNGCSCIVTGKNDSGKTSFLRGIIDRIRFIRPEVMVKHGEKEGRGELVLDSGDKFIWEFDTDKKDKLTYITKEGRQSVSKEFGKLFFPETFDIDKFLQSPPKSQVAQLQKIVGLDFTDIDKRYEAAYNFRTERNREAELYQAKLSKALKCDKVEYVDLTKLKADKEAERGRLNSLYLENKKKNEEKRKAWEQDKASIDKTVNAHNDFQGDLSATIAECSDSLEIIKKAGYKGAEVFMFIDGLKTQLKPNMVASDLYPKEPTYIEEKPSDETLQVIDNKIFEASQTNALAQKYSEYKELRESTESARVVADQANDAVLAIEDERKRMIATAKMPDGISITPDGITVDGFPLDKVQISTSKLYTAALKIASINLGEVRTLYFDASFLDHKTLSDIHTWASEQDLQLLVERPSWEADDIKYELIENI